MNCERFDKTTMELLYGELDELSEAAAMRHLHHCTRCRDIWGHLRTTKELSDIPLEDPPDDLFDLIMTAETNAQKNLPVRERFSRVISVLAGYAMRPQLTMAALLLLMIGSSLVFVRASPRGGENVAVTERGVPFVEQPRSKKSTQPLVFDGETEPPPPAAAATPEVAEREEFSPRPDHSGEKPEEKPAEKRATIPTRQTYSEAMLAYQDGRYAEAERLFSEVASAGSEQSASAALHEGHAARNGSGCQRAATLYDSVASTYPGSMVADEALWHAASCYRAMGQSRRALSHYQKLTEKAAYASRAQSALEEIKGSLEGPASPESELENPKQGLVSASRSKAAAESAADGSADTEAESVPSREPARPAAAPKASPSPQPKSP